MAENAYINEEFRLTGLKIFIRLRGEGQLLATATVYIGSLSIRGFRLQRTATEMLKKTKKPYWLSVPSIQQSDGKWMKIIKMRREIWDQLEAAIFYEYEHEKRITDFKDRSIDILS